MVYEAGSGAETVYSGKSRLPSLDSRHKDKPFHGVFFLQTGLHNPKPTYQAILSGQLGHRQSHHINSSHVRSPDPNVSILIEAVEALLVMREEQPRHLANGRVEAGVLRWAKSVDQAGSRSRIAN